MADSGDVTGEYDETQAEFAQDLLFLKSEWGHLTSFSDTTTTHFSSLEKRHGLYDARFDVIDRRFDQVTQILTRMETTYRSEKAFGKTIASPGDSQSPGNQSSSRPAPETIQPGMGIPPTVCETRESLLKQIDIPLFDGSSPFGWIARVERFFRRCQIVEEEKLSWMSLCFERDALFWYKRELANREFLNWGELKSRLLARFAPAKRSSRKALKLKQDLISQIDEEPNSFPKEASSISVLESSHKDKLLEGSDMHLVLEDQQLAISEVLSPIFAGLHSEMAENGEQSTCVQSSHSAYELFDILTLRGSRLWYKKKHRKSSKSWRYKFKPIRQQKFLQQNAYKLIDRKFMWNMRLRHRSTSLKHVIKGDMKQAFLCALGLWEETVISKEDSQTVSFCKAQFSLQEDDPMVFTRVSPYTFSYQNFFVYTEAPMRFLWMAEALGLFSSSTGIHVTCFVLIKHEDILSTTKKLKCCKSWHFKYKTKIHGRNNVGTMQFLFSRRLGVRTVNKSFIFVLRRWAVTTAYQWWLTRVWWCQLTEGENTNTEIETLLLDSEGLLLEVQDTFSRAVTMRGDIAVSVCLLVSPKQYPSKQHPISSKENNWYISQRIKFRILGLPFVEKYAEEAVTGLDTRQQWVLQTCILLIHLWWMKQQVFQPWHFKYQHRNRVRYKIEWEHHIGLLGNNYCDISAHVVVHVVFDHSEQIVRNGSERVSMLLQSQTRWQWHILQVDGSLRDAEMTLEQLSLLGQKISIPLVQELVGLVSDEKLVALLDLVLSAATVNTVKNLSTTMATSVVLLALMSQLAPVNTDILVGSFDFTKAWDRRKFFRQQPLSKEDREKLRHAFKTLSGAEKQLRVSNDKLTWLTSALLQLAPDQNYLLQHSSSAGSSFNRSPLPLENNGGSESSDHHLDFSSDAGQKRYQQQKKVEEMTTKLGSSTLVRSSRKHLEASQSQNKSQSIVRGKVSLAHVIQQADGCTLQNGWSKRKAVSIAEKLDQENMRKEELGKDQMHNVRGLLAARLRHNSLLIKLNCNLLHLHWHMAYKTVDTEGHKFFAIWHRWRIRDCVQGVYCIMEQCFLIFSLRTSCI